MNIEWHRNRARFAGGNNHAECAVKRLNDPLGSCLIYYPFWLNRDKSWPPPRVLAFRVDFPTFEIAFETRRPPSRGWKSAKESDTFGFTYLLPTYLPVRSRLLYIKPLKYYVLNVTYFALGSVRLFLKIYFFFIFCSDLWFFFWGGGRAIMLIADLLVN